MEIFGNYFYSSRERCELAIMDLQDSPDNLFRKLDGSLEHRKLSAIGFSRDPRSSYEQENDATSIEADYGTGKDQVPGL